MNTKEILIQDLKMCRVEGNILFLPSTQLLNYKEVRKALLKAGATYKRNTFVFNTDAQPFIDRLINGDSVNIAKEFQFFPTPENIAKYLVSQISFFTGASVLEPSAGQGALLDKLPKNFDLKIDCIEIMPENADILRRKGYNVKCEDFLQGQYNQYDIIIANPPFAKNQDIEHIRKMYGLLKPNGHLISISSTHWTFANDSKSIQFREWIEGKGSYYETEKVFGKEAFKNIGTMVNTMIIEMNRVQEQMKLTGLKQLHLF